MNYEDIVAAILAEHRQVFAALDQDNLVAFIDLVKSHERIFLVGVGREGLATKSFAMRLMHLGKQVFWIWDDTTPSIGSGDLLIATLGDGEIGHLHYVSERAKANGATVCIVTGSPSGKSVRELANYHLFLPASVYRGKDKVVPSMQPIGNLFEQTLFVLFDIVIMLIVDSSPDITFEAMSARHRNIE